LKPFYSIHPGEYLVGSHIEKYCKGLKVWMPTKDTGVDLLVTNEKNNKKAAIQVKFSKDFLLTHEKAEFQKALKGCGWWTLNRDKIVKSIADYWIFVLHSFGQKNIQYVIISPKELIERLDSIHGKSKIIQSYLWITKNEKCWVIFPRKSGHNEELVVG